MKLLSGQPIAENILDQVAHDSKQLHDRGITPTLAVILVGDDPGSKLYVSIKEKVAKQVGVDFLLYKFSESVKQVEIEQLLIALHIDETVHGVMVQLPLPAHLDTEKICQFIDPDKDVDGLLTKSKFPAPAPQAAIELMRFYDIDIKNKKVGLFGKGRLVGQPLKKMLEQEGANVTVFDTSSGEVAQESQNCDVLISATGQPDTIKPEFTKPSQTLIDVGGAYDVKKHKTVGDISPHARELAQSITPLIGGIGPVTVAVLLRNVLAAAQNICK